jgi:hypothetical protein
VFGKYKDKNILILGGGQSTLDTKWENLPYDYIWTCNDFYLEPRVLEQEIDLYVLAFTTPLQEERLINKLTNSETTVLYETSHYRGRQHTPKFKKFLETIQIPVHETELQFFRDVNRPAYKSGAAFRLIQLALSTEAKTIYFAGFDGFNKDFSNIHAFTKHKGLKSTDTRRDYEGHPMSYVSIFTDAYNVLKGVRGHESLQNLGEGFDYNIGTPISREYFPLTEETKKLL